MVHKPTNQHQKLDKAEETVQNLHKKANKAGTNGCAFLFFLVLMGFVLVLLQMF